MISSIMPTDNHSRATGSSTPYAFEETSRSNSYHKETSSTNMISSIIPTYNHSRATVSSAPSAYEGASRISRLYEESSADNHSHATVPFIPSTLETTKSISTFYEESSATSMVPSIQTDNYSRAKISSLPYASEQQLCIDKNPWYYNQSSTQVSPCFWKEQDRGRHDTFIQSSPSQDFRRSPLRRSPRHKKSQNLPSLKDPVFASPETQWISSPENTFSSKISTFTPPYVSEAQSSFDEMDLWYYNLNPPFLNTPSPPSETNWTSYNSQDHNAASHTVLKRSPRHAKAPPASPGPNQDCTPGQNKGDTVSKTPCSDKQ